MCLFIVQKKNKRKRKENQYTIRKIKEKKKKIISVQASHNTEFHSISYFISVISQDKSLDVSNSNLFYSYQTMTSFLKQLDLVIEYGKMKVFLLF